MAENYRTYQSRISVSPEGDDLLSSYALLFGKAEKTLFAKLESSKNLTPLKREFIKQFGLTARQFNSISASLNGRLASIKERRPGLIAEAERRIKKAKRVLKGTTDPAQLHQKKRKLAILQSRLDRLVKDHLSGKVRLCFGSNELFRKQFHLKDNGYASHNEWLKEWQASRNKQFFVIGSKDETAGCQSCVATIAENGSIALRIRLPNVLATRHLILKNICFAYGHDTITSAIGRNLSDNKDNWQAINYRFLKDDKGWRVFVSVAISKVQVISRKDIGVIGVDINANHLAITETDRFGNPVEYFPIPCVTYGKTLEQRRAIIGDAVCQAVAFAVCRSKPLVIERLKFQAKKAVLEGECPRYARMLSAMAYTLIQTIIRARAFDTGIEVHEVNPAYTSVIGQYKFRTRYGMSGHNASALVIGRRFFGFGETLPSQLQVTLPLSVRNRSRHVWSQWAVVSRKALAAPAAHMRSGNSRSLPSPVFDKARLVTIPPVAGEIPACESSSALFG